ncbi:MAG: metallophosphoesterase, partial [Clostridia bacterium]|nr:metallophosphoesterase [Clostridia bacterium]
IQKKTAKLTSFLLALLMTSVSCTGGTENPELPEPPAAAEPTPETEAVTAETEPTADPEPTDSPWQESRHRLRFGEDGDFRILVLSDIHGNGNTISGLAKTNMELLVERENPDLVMFGGDNTWGISDEKQLERCVADMVEILEEKQIPWGHVYGNHDAEGNNVKKDRQQKIYESFDYCVSQAGDADLPGVGNYVLPVYASDSDRVLFNVWALDSGEYLTSEESGSYLPVASTFQGYAGSSYDYISPELIRWYMDTSEQMEEANGAVVPGMMVFHIPLQESYNAWINREALSYTGEKREAVCASEINSGMFAAITERGDIKAVVNGHDHVNTYMVEYGGVKLCYCSTVSDTGYCDMDILGGRMFVVSEENPDDVQTYMSYVNEAYEEPSSSLAVIDAEPIPSGTVLLDFDSYTPELSFSGWNNDNSDAAETDRIVVELSESRGMDGTGALGVTRSSFADNNSGNNAEVRISLETPGLLGDNQYLRVRMDLTGDGTAVDFRKACFGFLENNRTAAPYRTDDLDSPSPFYFLADGETEWKTMQHGSDGCFGQAEGSSVRGLCGWFAFPVKNMRKGSTAPSSDTVITDIYFYYCLSSAPMTGNRVYIDDITLVNDYTVFD